MAAFLFYVFHLGFITYLLFFFYRNIKISSLKPYFLPGILLKILAGITLGLLYKFYYPGGDTFAFFRDASSLIDIGLQNPGMYLNIITSQNINNPEIEKVLIFEDQPRAFLMVKILSLIGFFTGKNYWISSVYFSMFSFAGTWYFLQKIVVINPDNIWAGITAFLFLPSFVFWSSGILKESVTIGCIFFLLGIWVPWLIPDKNANKLIQNNYLHIYIFKLLIATAALGWVILHLKYYYAAVLFPLLLVTILIQILERYHVINRENHKIAAWFIIVLGALPLFTFIHPNLYPDNIWNVIINNHNIFLEKSNAEDLIHYFPFEQKGLYFLLNFPIALFAGLFRPLPWEAGNVLQFISAVENLFILIFVILAIIKSIKNPHKRIGFYGLVIIFYLVLLATFIALSTPNFGTIARYKVAYWPFLIFMCLWILLPGTTNTFTTLKRKIIHLYVKK